MYGWEKWEERKANWGLPKEVPSGSYEEYNELAHYDKVTGVFTGYKGSFPNNCGNPGAEQGRSPYTALRPGDPLPPYCVTQGLNPTIVPLSLQPRLGPSDIYIHWDPPGFGRSVPPHFLDSHDKNGKLIPIYMRMFRILYEKLARDRSEHNSPPHIEWLAQCLELEGSELNGWCNTGLPLYKLLPVGHPLGEFPFTKSPSTPSGAPPAPSPTPPPPHHPSSAFNNQPLPFPPSELPKVMIRGSVLDNGFPNQEYMRTFFLRAMMHVKPGLREQILQINPYVKTQEPDRGWPNPPYPFTPIGIPDPRQFEEDLRGMVTIIQEEMVIRFQKQGKSFEESVRLACIGLEGVELNPPTSVGASGGGGGQGQEHPHSLPPTYVPPKLSKNFVVVPPEGFGWDAHVSGWSPPPAPPLPQP